MPFFSLYNSFPLCRFLNCLFCLSAVLESFLDVWWSWIMIKVGGWCTRFQAHRMSLAPWRDRAGLYLQNHLCRFLWVFPVGLVKCAMVESFCLQFGEQRSCSHHLGSMAVREASNPITFCFSFFWRKPPHPDWSTGRTVSSGLCVRNLTHFTLIFSHHFHSYRGTLDCQFLRVMQCKSSHS